MKGDHITGLQRWAKLQTPINFIPRNEGSCVILKPKGITEPPEPRKGIRRMDCDTLIFNMAEKTRPLF